MKTRAEKHHEHLTEEEKKMSAQIRSVAATLYERVDLYKPTVEFLCEHFYKNPTLALAYYYWCSADPCVAIFNDKLKWDVDNFKLVQESHSARRSNALSINIQQPWPITCKNCCLCILLQALFECRWSTRNYWDENRLFAFRVPSNWIANRTLDYIATVHCSKLNSSNELQWNLLSFESKCGVWCESNSALSCVCRKSNDQRSGEYCSRQRLWKTWQFETTDWYDLECTCTCLIKKHGFANTS
jgi:hypothetical protein